MSDVKVEYEQKISRDEAAALLSQLARAFTGDSDAEFPFGPFTLTLDVPRNVRAELEVEVEDDQVEVEIEFTWPLTPRSRESAAAGATRLKTTGRPPARPAGPSPSARAGRARRK